MSLRILLLVVVTALSGCAVNADCAYGIVPQSQPAEPARCMSRSEYIVAKEKLRQPRDEASPQVDRPSWETQTKDRIEAIDDK